MAIIGISGFAGSGKDTVGNIIKEISVKWETKSWANKLKQICSILTGIPLEKFEDQEFKKTHLGPEWAVFSRIIKDERGYPTDVENRLITVREMLQMIGTDCLRNKFNYNIWINALMADYVPTQVQWADGPLGGYEDGPLPNWIITDTRFTNEVEAIKKRGGKVIRVVRDAIKPPNNHSSEMELYHYKGFDYMLENNGNIEDLKHGVAKMMIELGFELKPSIYNYQK